MPWRPDERDVLEAERRTELRSAADLEQVPCEAEARHVGEGMHAVEVDSRAPGVLSLVVHLIISA